MRIAWIDHTIDALFLRETFGLVMRVEYGVELDGAKSWEEFEELYGSVEKYDGLLIHPGIKKQKNYIKLVKRLNIPIAIITNSDIDYEESDIPVLCYSSKNSIVEFFRERQVQRNK